MTKQTQNSKLKTINRNNGFTLIELLIFMGIFSILMVVLLQLFTAIFDAQLESQSVSAVAQDGRFIINKLTNDIKNATIVTVPAAGAQGQVLTMTDGINNYTYSLDSGNLILSMTPSGTTDQLNSANTSVSSINFLRLSDTEALDKSTVSVSLNLTSKTSKRSGFKSAVFNFTAGTR